MPSMDLLCPVINLRIRRNCGRGPGNDKSGLPLLFIGMDVLAVTSSAVRSYRIKIGR